MAVQWVGANELQAKFKGYPEEVRNNIIKVLKISCLKIQGDAQGSVPVATGRLKASINYKVEEDGENIRAIVGPNAANPTGEIGYATFIEYGTSRMNAQPYMQPAIEDNKDAIADNLSKVIGELK